MEALIAEQGELQEKIDPRRRLGARPHGRNRDGCAALPAGRNPVATLSGGERRRVALCRLLLHRPTCCCSTSRPTISTPIGRLAAALLKDYPGTVVTVTHDRYFLDDVAGWILELDRGHGIPFEGNYSGWLEQKQERLAQEGRQEEARQRTPRTRARMGAAEPARPPGEEQGAPPGL